MQPLSVFQARYNERAEITRQREALPAGISQDLLHIQVRGAGAQLPALPRRRARWQRERPQRRSSAAGGTSAPAAALPFLHGESARARPGEVFPSQHRSG